MGSGREMDSADGGEGRLRFAGAKRQPTVGSGNAVELFFSRSAIPADQRVLLFHHIPKTAGTSFRRFIEANLRGCRHLYLDIPRGHESLGDWYADFYSALTKKERSQLLAIASHSANYLIPILERPIIAVTMIRDPVERCISRYHFIKEPEGEFEDIFKSDSPKAKPDFFNGQARSLLEPHFDLSELPLSVGPPRETADLWRTRLFTVLARHYWVGIQERYSESVDMFADQLGWRQVVARLRVNAGRPDDAELDGPALRRVRACNWLDMEMHRHYAEAFEGWPLHGAAAEMAQRDHANSLALRIRMAALEDSVRAHQISGITIGRGKKPRSGSDRKQGTRDPVRSRTKGLRRGKLDEADMKQEEDGPAAESRHDDGAS